jgi:hypothetical protein
VWVKAVVAAFVALVSLPDISADAHFIAGDSLNVGAVDSNCSVTFADRISAYIEREHCVMDIATCGGSISNTPNNDWHNQSSRGWFNPWWQVIPAPIMSGLAVFDSTRNEPCNNLRHEIENGIKSQIGIGEYDCVSSISHRTASIFNGLNFLAVACHIGHFIDVSVQYDVHCGSSAGICERKIGFPKKIIAVAIMADGHVSHLRGLNRDPWPLMYLSLVQLMLHNVFLFCEDRCLGETNPALVTRINSKSIVNVAMATVAMAVTSPSCESSQETALPSGPHTKRSQSFLVRSAYCLVLS